MTIFSPYRKKVVSLQSQTDRKGLSRESAFSLGSAIGELGHFTQYKVRIGNEFSLGLYSYIYDIHQVEKFRKPYPLCTTGSPSPTNRDRIKWMAPLSFVMLNSSQTASEPKAQKLHPTRIRVEKK